MYIIKGIRYIIQGIRYIIQGIRYRIQGIRYRIQGHKIQDTGHKKKIVSSLSGLYVHYTLVWRISEDIRYKCYHLLLM